MAQRKSPSGGKPAAKKGTTRPAGKPGASSSANLGAGPRKAPPRKPGKSIVNQKQTPWGMIISIAAVVAFAAVVVVVVIATGGSDKQDATGSGKCSAQANQGYCNPELAAAKQIQGVVYKAEPRHTHVMHTVTYDTTPPTGGDHSQYWADCDGTVYPNAIANENAVHALEHGAVWVTYREGLPADQVSTLAQNVTGQNFVFMSPYPNLASKVSLQSWDYQLFVNNVTDPRISQFIATLSNNPKTTPEQTSCANASFKAQPSTFGHPQFTVPAGGASMSS